MPKHFPIEAAWSKALRGTVGNSVRGRFQRHGPWNLDLSLFKGFMFMERFKLQCRTEFFNILNHTNFSDPNKGMPLFSSPIQTRNTRLSFTMEVL
jgi:hypothetical protein